MRAAKMDARQFIGGRMSLMPKVAYSILLMHEEGKNLFDNARQTVIREMEAIKDAAVQLAILQQFAVHPTKMRIRDQNVGAKE